jgi:O-antigen/teichoic acid export membrane protein
MISFKILLRDVLFYTISKLVPGITGLVSVILFVRILGIEEYGNYSLLLSQCYLIAAFGYGWLNQAQLRYYNKDNLLEGYESDQKRGFILSSIVSFIILTFFIFNQSLSMITLMISFICIFSIGGFNYLKTLYQSKLSPKKIVSLYLIQSILLLIIPLLLLYLFQKKAIIVLIGAALSFLILPLIYLLNKFQINELFKDLSHNGKSVISKWIYYGSPLSLWFAAGLALPFLDRYFINQYLSDVELGVYASVQEILTKMFSLLIFPITMAIHPRIMNYWDSSKKQEAVRLIKWGIIFMSFIALFVFTVFWFFDDFIFDGLKKITPQFKIENKHIIIPLVLTGFLWQLSFLTHKVLELKEKTKIMVLFILFSLLINIFGNNYFVPSYGIIATAFIGLLSAFVYCILTSIYSLFAVINSKGLSIK